MSQQQQHMMPEDGQPGHGSGQQQDESEAEGHGGHGSESAMKQLRAWEQRRADNSGGKRRPGPS